MNDKQRWIDTRQDSTAPIKQKARRFTPEQRATLIDFAAERIQQVWDDAGATTAQVLAENVVSAQEFAWLSMHFPIAPATAEALAASNTEVARLRSLVEEAASALVQRGFTDRAQWLRNKAENGEGR